jgi:hypothetical protein
LLVVAGVQAAVVVQVVSFQVQRMLLLLEILPLLLLVLVALLVLKQVATHRLEVILPFIH